MKVNKVQMLKCQKCGAFYRIVDIDTTKENIDDFRSKHLLGYGLEGYAVACVYGNVLKVGVTFGREKEKNHGTEKNIDGYSVDSTDSCVLFCASDKIKAALNRFSNYNIVSIYTFNVEQKAIVQIVSCSDYGETNGKFCSSSLEKYVLYLEGGSYTLSSGKISNSYYETLPAANTYGAVRTVVEEFYTKIQKYNTAVGIGYGGVYLGVCASLALQKELLVFDSDSMREPSLINRQSAVFFDDYISTGKSIKQAYQSLNCTAHCSAIIMYAREKCKLLEPEINIACLLKS